MDKKAKILVVGHNDIIEKSLMHCLEQMGFSRLFSFSRLGLDSTVQDVVNHFFVNEKPDYVFLSSVRSGGIQANQQYPAQFCYENSQSQNNVIEAAHKFKAKKLLYCASSCVYPKDCPQPMREEHLMTGPMEKTSEAYSMAKLTGIKLCHAYQRQHGFNAIVVIPATVYGPGSDISEKTSHVLGALIHRFYEAKVNNHSEVVIWGNGEAYREFIFSDDFAQACFFLMDQYSGKSLVNIGTGQDLSIKELAQMIKDICGFTGKIVFDISKPQGPKKKLLDSELARSLGWKPQVDIRQGIERTLKWYFNEREKAK